MKNLYALVLFCTLFLIVFSFNVCAYDWNFSTPSDYIYNSTEIVVSGGNAYLNGTISTPIYARWHLNENNGTNAGDSSGNNYNGTLMSSPSWIIGKLNNALQFDGTTQWVDFGNSTANFERTQAFSVELWLKTSATGQQLLISKMQPTGNYAGWEVYFEGTSTNRIYFDLSNIATTNMIRVYCSAGVVADNNWHHLIVTYDGSSNATGVKFYYDGVLKTTGVTYNTLTASIQTTTKFQLSGRGGSGLMGITGFLDEVVIYNGTLSSAKVTSRYNSGSGTENAVGDYPLGNYTIQPINNLSFSIPLNKFNETAIKTGSDIRYSVTSNGTWVYWNGTSWVNSDGSWSQSNSASDINPHIGTLASSGSFSFRAVLHSTDGTYTPYLDNIEVSSCVESWVNYNTTCGNYCGNWDKFQTYYLDTNNCGTNISFPANNGTCFSCNYCSPTWKCDLFNATCGDTFTNPEFIYCTNVSTTNYASCCAITGLPSDCTTYTGDFSEFTGLCGDIRVVLELNSYPYVDVNTSYPMNIYLYQNNVSKNLTTFQIKLTSPNLTSSIFNFTWNNANQRYETTFIFTEIGNYPFVIYAFYPYDNIKNITGTLRVFEPYYITFRIFELQNNATTPYENDLGYIFAEFSNNQFGYDNNLENFISPLLFSYTFNKSVFHAPYINGEAILKLWEADKYAVRFVDGDISFDNEYSKPIVNKLYGTNFFIDEYTFNGTSKTINVYMEGKDIHPYTWLFNVILIILIVLCLISAVAIFFVVPQYPTISITMGLVFPIILIIIRIILYILVA